MSQLDLGRNGDMRLRNRGVAADELRRHNLATVLEPLHLLGPHSRSELTTMTGLNRSTVGDLIGELGALGLVDEGPASNVSGPGRPSPVVSARPAGAVVLALELDVDSIGAATVGLGGHLYDRRRVTRPVDHCSPHEIVSDAVALSAPLLSALPAGHHLVGIGVGVAGVTRRDDGFVHLAPNLGWQDVPLAAIVAGELGTACPVLVANEADLGAFGEFRRGVQPGVQHLIYLSGEVGIGAGVIVDGHLLRGLAGYAGEAGHTKVNPNGRPCRCGSVGCWETEAGQGALLRRLGLETGTGPAALDRIVEKAAAGDTATIDAIAELGRWLGIGVGNLINIFNPEIVVLGGMYDRLFPFIEPTVTSEVRSGALAASESMAQIIRSGLGSDAPLIGASEAVFSRVVSDPAAVRSEILIPPT